MLNRAKLVIVDGSVDKRVGRLDNRTDSRAENRASSKGEVLRFLSCTVSASTLLRYSTCESRCCKWQPT